MYWFLMVMCLWFLGMVVFGECVVAEVINSVLAAACFAEAVVWEATHRE